MSDYYCIRGQVTLKRDHAGRPVMVRSWRSPIFRKDREAESESAWGELERQLFMEGYRLRQLWNVEICRVPGPETI